MALIALRKPWQKGIDESFNGKFGDELPQRRVVSLPELSARHHRGFAPALRPRLP